MNRSSPNVDPVVQQQIAAFYQSLLRQAQQFQTLPQYLMARNLELVSELEPELPKPKSRNRRKLSAVLQSALTGASHWLIARWLALETEEIVEVPLPDGKDVIVIDANYTIILPERKEMAHEFTHPLDASKRTGTAQGSDQPHPSAHRAGDAGGGTPATDGGQRGRNDAHHCATRN